MSTETESTETEPEVETPAAEAEVVTPESPAPESAEDLLLSAYESVLIFKPNLAEEKIEAALLKGTGIIEAGGGKVISSDNWGKKRLAYEVQRERKGIYVVTHFKGLPSSIIELEQHYRFSEAIIKYMIVRIEKKDLGKSAPLVEDKTSSFRGRDSRRWR